MESKTKSAGEGEVSSSVKSTKAPSNNKMKWLFIAVIVGVVAGIAVGSFFGEKVVGLAFLGSAFVGLIKMMVPAIIFCTIVQGVGSVKAAATVGKIGGIALVYFITMTTFALGIGLAVGNFVKAGTGLNLENLHYEVQKKAEGPGGLVGFIQGLIPESVFAPLVSHNVLQVLIVALLVGFALLGMGKAGEPVLQLVGSVQKIVFKIMGWILWLAPIGAFGAMAGVMATTGWKAVLALAKLILTYYATCAIFIFLVLGVMLKIFTGLSIGKLFKYLANELVIVLATSSSETGLPHLMQKLEHMGVEKATVGLVIPTGYSFNLDGSSMYVTMCAIFISDAMNKPMGLGEQIGLLVFLIIASKGIAGVTGAGLATLAAGLETYRPELVDGVSLIVGIDRLMDEARTLTNFIGNAVATLIVATWTHTLDKKRVAETLDGKHPFIYNQEEDEIEQTQSVPA
ncbi:MAG: cation:dicarboxylase symporter family transporter [Winkia neuii]|uniref:dicarboxylate/amino acid:cation symporter n=1 Tax=Winkia neuii TaxID=33007 RepID=UPI002904A3E6|nr:cation:dicarboxylase symporter family transporter [Winkia neuii]MDU3134723.1 cation:dicarboxylase symporter family transporter [Winkia neuii]